MERIRTQFLNQSFRNFLDNIQPPEELVLVTSAVIIGVGTGFGAVLFVWLLGQIQSAVIWFQGHVGSIVGLFVPMILSGLVVGYMVDRWASEAKGHGVPEVMEAVAVRGGRIRPIVAGVKILASSLTIGVGGSAGREGPIVQVGSALGSSLGQFLHFSNERVRILVACGAGAGIAATFNAPIAGSIFALEVILQQFTVRYFGAVVISSVSASIIGRIFLGDKPAFAVPSYPLNSLGELPIYILLGLLSAVVAVIFIRSLYFIEGRFDHWQISLPIKAAIGMALTGVIALLLPGRDVLGPGLDRIGETIAGDFNVSLGFMAVLLVAKLLATCFTLGSGNSGGVFAPSLFMGAVLGGMVGAVMQALFPTLVVHPGAYAIVGMASVFAGAARAPITAVLIVFEMSNDYRLILPLMLATVLSTIIAELMFKESIYTLKLKLKGVSLQSGMDMDILQGVEISEVMTRNYDTIDKDATLTELSDLLNNTHHHGLPILDDEKNFWGIVTVTDVERAVAENMPRTTPVSKLGVGRNRVLVAYPDESISEALHRMGVRGIGRLPVLSREHPNQLVGLVRRDDIIRAYQVGLARRGEIQHRAKRMRLRDIDGTDFTEITVQEGDTVIGKSVQSIAESLPNDCVLISLRRQGRIIIPRGNTIFRVGDHITAFIKSQDVVQLERCFRESPDVLEESS